MGQRKKPTVVSLFTGAGGLDYGLEAAGFQHVVAVEMDHDACETVRKNRPKWNVIEGKIEDVSGEAIMETGNFKKGEVSLVCGGPPCQPFSKSSYWSKGDSKRLDDPRAKTLDHFIRVVEETQPQVVLLENVAGIAFSEKDEGIKFLLNQFEAINKKVGTNYQPTCAVLKMVEYGVPQLRERFFLIADRDGRIFSFPEPTHLHPDQVSDAPTLFESRELPMTAWDAIGHLSDPTDDHLRISGKWADLLPSIPEGENYLWHTDRKGGMPLFGWRTRYWGFLLKLAKNRPSWTIQAQPGSAIGPFHWENRKLSCDEMLRLMTFPEIEVVGGRTSLQRQLGNAVPSLMTEIIGNELLNQFFGKRKKSKLRLMPERNPSAEPEKVKRVPKKYHEYAGTHDAHPGTGKGPMALKRKAGVVS